MPHYNTLFGSILSHIPRHQFENLVNTYQGDRYAKKLSTWNQFSTLLYAQASGQESLREIEQTLLSHRSKLYHLGLPSKICRNTLSHANTRRNWRIYHDFFYKLLMRCKDLTPKHRFKFKNPLYSLDATTVSLCLSMFPWSKIKHKKGAIKMHCGFDHAGDIPAFCVVTRGNANDATVAKKHFSLSQDSIYCFDRGYVDAAWFRRIDDAGAFFVTRAKTSMKYRFVGQHADAKLKLGVLSDEIIEFTGVQSKQRYPRWFRLIRYYDKEQDKTFVFISNNLKMSAKTIANIYKARWQIEIFFRWIKQNLKIKTFLGTSENAVLTQIWTAMCYYLILAYLKYQTKYTPSLYYLHRVIKAVIFERISFLDLVNINENRLARIRDDDLSQFMLPI